MAEHMSQIRTIAFMCALCGQDAEKSEDDPTVLFVERRRRPHDEVSRGQTWFVHWACFREKLAPMLPMVRGSGTEDDPDDPDMWGDEVEIEVRAGTRTDES